MDEGKPVILNRSVTIDLFYNDTINRQQVLIDRDGTKRIYLPSQTNIRRLNRLVSHLVEHNRMTMLPHRLGAGWMACAVRSRQ